MTHVKKTKDSSNEYDAIFVLKHKALYEGLREYFMSLMPKEQVHATVVSIHSIILNQIKTRRYQEQIYIVPLDIVLFVPIFNGAHWWFWIANVKKKKLYVLDPINKLKKYIPDSRVMLNKFVGLIISQRRVYAGAEPLNGRWAGKRSRVYPIKWSTIYVMKWLETIDPQKIKSGKRYKYRVWTQEEIDDFRYQYGPNLLLHEMNKIREQYSVSETPELSDIAK
ncbi:hypothetical protein Ahy_B08g089945 [Arachis hypogaea]|uniref:Ubiquitin-like protease family profile domain-containing protein n=1 Tax=Arachis hypogaea TaxID=3818 RepID=A0A444XZ65_ARAHY|nr:hypothetical protein Ahy_B08g089945 [Arachis hypogaea]